MHLFRSMCSGEIGGTYVIGILEKEYINSFLIAYPVTFDRNQFGDIINITPCNLSNLNNLIDRYNINIEKFKFLYDIGFDTIPHDIRQFYINYLKIQNINYYEQKEIFNSGFLDDEFDLD